MMYPQLPRIRSLLFVPGDRSDLMTKARKAGADALILDLEDAVTSQNKNAARAAVSAFLNESGEKGVVFVRVNALGSGQTDADLAAVLPARPTGIVLPKTEGAASLRALDEKLCVRGDTQTLILPIVSETPGSVFRLGELKDVTPRLVGITWGAEDLSTEIGGRFSRDDAGELTSPLQVARALTLFGAASAGVAAIETVYPSFRDSEGLKRCADRASVAGFQGMLAIHPSQVSVINAAFMPSDAEISHARSVLEAYAAMGDGGVVAVDGKMVDGPHVRRARRILDQSGQAL